MNKNFQIVITIFMALLVGVMIGIAVGMNLKPVEIRSGDTYEYHEKAEEQMEIDPFYN